jgi:hypothetical protein
MKPYLTLGRLRRLVLPATFTIVLAACGGSAQSTEAPTNTATAPATQSPASQSPVAAPTASISSSPSSISAGQSSVLTWTATNAATAQIDNGIGTVPTNASVTVKPAQTTTYTLSVSGPGGTATAQTTVTISALPSAPSAPSAPGSDFTIVVLPDTQYYSASLEGGNPTMFAAQTAWIAANQAARNIVYVVHLGDIVQNGDDNPQEWQNASAAMQTLDEAGIAYGVAVGNHDETPEGTAGGTTLFNQYFGVSRFSGRAYYGGNYGETNDNHYDLFSAGGLDFVVVYLSYDPSANPDVLAWAKQVLATYSSRRAIVVSHFILNGGFNASFGPQGQAIYNALKSSPNLFLMLSGHVTPITEGQRQDTYNGHTIYSLMSDYQSLEDGGDGWLRILHFSPSANQISVSTYSPVLDEFENTSSGQFTLAYDMQSDTAAKREGPRLPPEKARGWALMSHSYSPYMFSSVFQSAIWDQMMGNRASYGGGMQGFGKRFGADLAGAEASSFFKTSLFPSLLHQDPRYYPRRSGRVLPRAWYAVTQVLLAHKLSGGRTINGAELLGDLFIRSFANAYIPRQDRGFGPTLNGAAGAILSDAQSNLLREFAPDIRRIFRKHEPEGAKKLEKKMPERLQKLAHIGYYQE